MGVSGLKPGNLARLRIRHGPDGTPAGIPPRRHVRRVVVALGVAAACSGEPAPRVTIGLLVSTDEDLSPPSYAQVLREGARLAVDDANATGGVLIAGVRHRVELRERTHEPRSNDVTSATLALINLDSAQVIIGPVNTFLGIPASSVAEPAGVPLISQSATSARLTDGKRYIFRIAADDSLQGPELARYALETLGARRAATLFDETTVYTRMLAAGFSEAFARGGGRVVASETYTPDRRGDLRDQMARIAAMRPEVLLLPNPSPADSIQVRQAREAGITATFLAGDNWDLRRVERLPEAEGTVAIRQWHEDVPRERSRAFVRRYREVYGDVPRLTAAATYDAVRLALDAIGRANSLDGDAIRAAIASTADFEGVTGWMRFVGRQDAGRGGVLVRITDGRNVLVRVVEPVR
jgi:branched-chain amino acid transport system substrate-binding protein